MAGPSADGDVKRLPAAAVPLAQVDLPPHELTVSAVSAVYRSLAAARTARAHS